MKRKIIKKKIQTDDIINGPTTTSVWTVKFKGKIYKVCTTIYGDDTDYYWEIKPKDKYEDEILAIVHEDIYDNGDFK